METRTRQAIALWVLAVLSIYESIVGHRTESALFLCFAVLMWANQD